MMVSTISVPAPFVSIVVPTYGRAEFIRTLVERLAVEIERCGSEAVEVVVSDNHSHDHTASVLAEAAARFPWLTVVGPEKHLFSGEENFYFALPYARGEYVWGFGDDDDMLDGALGRLITFLKSRRPDFALFNVATMTQDGVPTRAKFVDMDAGELWWPIDRLVAAVGFMGLSACFSAVVARREMLLAADWRAHLERSTVYAHVAAYIEAFHGARSVLVDEVMVVARQGATGLKEFARLTNAMGRAVTWPWAVGLTRHLDALISRNVAPIDFASRICERGEPRTRLLPTVIRMMARQMRAWLVERTSSHRILFDDVGRLARLSASAPPAEREVARQLAELWGAVASLVGDEAAPDGGAAGEALPGLATLILERILAFGQEMAREPYALALADCLQTLESGGGRNASGSSSAKHLTFAALFEPLPSALSAEVGGLVAAQLSARLDQIESRLTFDLAPDWTTLTSDRLGAYALALGGLFVSLPCGRPLTHDEREDLNLVDMRGVGEVVAAETWDGLMEGRTARLGSMVQDWKEEERFADWALGSVRGRRTAFWTSADGQPHVVRASGDRLALRRSVLEARRRLALPEGGAEAAAALIRPTSQDERLRIAKENALFDPNWYGRAYPAALIAIEHGVVADELQHWLEIGGRFGLDPMGWFDSDDYFALSPESLASVEQARYPTALHHYLAEGAWQGAAPFFPFDPAYYIDLYADAREAFERGVTPLEHFLAVGLAEGRAISLRFDEASYLRANPDVARAAPAGSVNFGLLHFRANGRSEGRSLGKRVVAA